MDRTFTPDDWRVLGEIRTIWHNSFHDFATIPHFDRQGVHELPYPFVDQTAFFLSPYSIAKRAQLDSSIVRYSSDHLIDEGYLERASDEPKSLIVVQEVKFTWRRWLYYKLYQLVPPRRGGWDSPIKGTVGKLPGPNSVVIEPCYRGPGIVKPEFQGSRLKLTQRAQIELRAYAEERREEGRRRRDSRLTLVLVLLTATLLISAVADAPQAWHVIEAWVHGKSVPK